MSSTFASVIDPVCTNVPRCQKERKKWIGVRHFLQHTKKSNRSDLPISSFSNFPFRAVWIFLLRLRRWNLNREWWINKIFELSWPIHVVTILHKVSVMNMLSRKGRSNNNNSSRSSMTDTKKLFLNNSQNTLAAMRQLIAFYTTIKQFFVFGYVCLCVYVCTYKRVIGGIIMLKWKMAWWSNLVQLILSSTMTFGRKIHKRSKWQKAYFWKINGKIISSGN